MRFNFTSISTEAESGKTEIWYGIDDFVAKTLECISIITERLDICGDAINPCVQISVGPIMDAYFKLKQRGINIRFVTEITKENIHCCKKVMEFAEVRHLDNIVGNFGVSERDYIAAITGESKTNYLTALKDQKAEPLSEAVHSNVKSFVEHQQFFFETLWNRAIPAEEKIREIEQGISPRRIEILRGAESIINLTLQLLSGTKERFDLCCDRTFPSVVNAVEPIKKAYVELRNRGIRFRFITEITNENIQYCREIMQFSELRHLDALKGNFGITESHYMASATQQEASPITQAIFSNVKDVVEQQHYIFETLWNKAIPAVEKIREIEEGIKPDLIETIRDPDSIQKLGIKLLKSAEKEVLIIFSTANAFKRQERVGMIQLLTEIAAAQPGMKIRILSPAGTVVQQTAGEFAKKRIKEKQHQAIDIRCMVPPSQTRVSILLVDRKFSLAVELKDDSKLNSLEAIGLATYSNSQATVLSYVSIFESLWSLTELYEQMKVSNSKLENLNDQLQDHDKMQKEFINIAAHELRTPIQPILGLSEVLRSKPTTKEQRKFLDAIIRSAQRLQHLTDDVLDVTRIEGHSLVLRKEIASIRDIIDDTIRSFDGQMERSGVKVLVQNAFSNSRENGDAHIFVDKGRVTQVLVNLLGNSMKFTKKGTIRIGVEKNRNEVVVSVKDTGPGIDSEIFPRLFTKFATKSEKGTGLGLFISRSIVEAHGGRIWAENNADGKGATFSFSLPLHST